MNCSFSTAVAHREAEAFICSAAGKIGQAVVAVAYGTGVNSGLFGVATVAYVAGKLKLLLNSLKYCLNGYFFIR